MDANRITSLLATQSQVLVFDELPSTNDLAMDLARQGAAQGSLVLARHQTRGRGRRGRNFYSPRGGLYLSLILDSQGQSPGLLTTLAALCAREAVLRVCGADLSIKWINDLILDGKKVGGILCEGIYGGAFGDKVVVGLGLNTGEMDLPEELKQIAGSLAGDGKPVDQEALAARFVQEVLQGLARMPSHLSAYQRHCQTLGQQVAFEQSGQVITGEARAVDEQGCLLVQTKTGLIRLMDGDVSLIPPR